MRNVTINGIKDNENDVVVYRSHNCIAILSENGETFYTKHVMEGRTDDNYSSELFFKFDQYHMLNTLEKEKLVELIAESRFHLLDDLSFSYQRPDLEQRSKDVLSNAKYILNHDSDNNLVKIVLFAANSSVRFLNEEVIDELLGSSSFKKHIPNAGRTISNLFFPNNKNLDDLSSYEPEEYLRLNRLSHWWLASDLSSTFVNNEATDFFEISKGYKNTVDSNLFKLFINEIYFYDANGNEGYDESFWNIHHAINVSFKGFEEVSAFEFIAFLSATNFHEKYKDIGYGEKKDSDGGFDVPTLENFLNSYSVDKNRFDMSRFKVIVAELLSDEVMLNVMECYHYYAFIYALLDYDEIAFVEVANATHNIDRKKLVSTNFLNFVNTYKANGNEANIPVSMLMKLDGVFA